MHAPSDVHIFQALIDIKDVLIDMQFRSVEECSKVTLSAEENVSHKDKADLSRRCVKKIERDVDEVETRRQQAVNKICREVETAVSVAHRGSVEKNRARDSNKRVSRHRGACAPLFR